MDWLLLNGLIHWDSTSGDEGGGGDITEQPHQTVPLDDGSEFKDSRDPLSDAAGDIADTPPEGGEPQDPPQDPPAEPTTEPAAPPANNDGEGGEGDDGDSEPLQPPTEEELANIIDSSGYSIGEEGFNPDNLELDDYSKWLASLDDSKSEEELDRLSASMEADLAELEAISEEPDDKYIDMAREFQRQQQGGDNEPNPDPAQNAPPVETPQIIQDPLTPEKLAEAMGVEFKSFSELPEDVQKGLTQFAEDQRQAALTAKQEAEQKAIALKEIEQQKEYQEAEARKAYQKRDQFKHQLEERQKETFKAAAAQMGVPEDMQEIAYQNAVFVDKNQEGIPLKNVFALLRKDYPSLFKEDAPPPKPPKAGTRTGGRPPRKSDTPKREVDYSDARDPLDLAAQEVARGSLEK